MGNNRRTPSERERVRIRAAILLLGVLTVCLVLVLQLLPNRRSRAAAPDSEPEASETVAPTATGEPSPETGGSVAALPGPVEPKPVGTLYLVIDDVGNNLAQLDRFLVFPAPLTFAVMPKRPFTEESVKRILSHGYEAILHQPMEPVGDANPGPAALYTSMSRDEIESLLEENLEGLDGIAGLNNHMGSKATADPATMASVMDFLSRRGMFFLDSVTTDVSVAESAAKHYGVPFAKRTSDFLDNDADFDSVLAALNRGLEHAARDGSAVLIGHIHSDAFFDVLFSEYDRITDEGYTFSALNEYPSLRSQDRSKP